MMNMWRKRIKLGNERGFTLIELMIVVAIIGILAAIAIPLMQNIQSRARIAKATSDIRSIASAVVQYSAHCGGLPGQANADSCDPANTAAVAGNSSGGGAFPGSATVVIRNAQNQSAGPFFNTWPTVPGGWTAPYTVNIPAAKATTPQCVIPAGGTGTFNVTVGAGNGDITAGQLLAAPGC